MLRMLRSRYLLLSQALRLPRDPVVIPAKAGIQSHARCGLGRTQTAVRSVESSNCSAVRRRTPKPEPPRGTLGACLSCFRKVRRKHDKRYVTSVSIVLLLLCPALAAAQSVFAAASLSSALTELTTHYEGMRLSVASSSTLAKQIAAGAPADIYFSANAEWMDYLQTRQHIEQDTRVNLLGNALVVIAPREEAFAVRFARDFAFAGAFVGRLALGDPDHVPAGQYARQALEALGWWSALRTRIAPAPDVRAALVYVERGECAAGLVYATDAAQSDRVITLATVPDSLHRPIVYPAAIVKGRATAKVRDLLAFFSSDTAAVIFRKHGFTFLGDQRVQH